MSLSQWKVTARAPLIFAHGQVSCMRKTIEHAHAQLTVVIVAPPEHAGQAASDADHVKVPNTDFTTVLSPHELRASGHRVSASPTALPGATAVSGNRSTSYGNVSSRSTKSWCTALRGSAAGTRDSRPRKRVRKWSGYICTPGRRRGYRGTTLITDTVAHDSWIMLS